MSCCDSPVIDIYECQWCQCQFEEGVAGLTREGKPRCPQCGLTEARLLAPEEIGDFVVSRSTSFR